MVAFNRSNDAKKIRTDWHEFRANARRTAFSEDEFAPGARTEYDLDTAQITGEDNPRSYTYDRPVDILGENGTDVRELDDR